MTQAQAPAALLVIHTLDDQHVPHTTFSHLLSHVPAGNGMSDKPQLFSSRGTQWNIDDYVEKDVPAIIRFVLKETHAQQVHFLGHSMVSDWGAARQSMTQHEAALVITTWSCACMMQLMCSTAWHSMVGDWGAAWHSMVGDGAQGDPCTAGPLPGAQHGE
jgi:hypothetical protein